jgi:hypothetical protein
MSVTFFWLFGSYTICIHAVLYNSENLINIESNG